LVKENPIEKESYKTSIVQLLVEQAARTPSACALSSYSLTEKKVIDLSYRELTDRVDHIAFLLCRRGVTRGDRVGVFIERTVEMPLALLGIMKAGGTYVPLDTDFPQERLSFIVKDAAVNVVITQRSLVPMLPFKGVGTLCVDDEEAVPPCAADVGCWRDVLATDLAYVAYTSGSTGSPKGIGISHAGLSNFLVSMKTRPGICAGDVMLATTTISFDPSTLELLLPLISGARVVLEGRQVAMDGTLLQREIERNRATILQATPSRYRLLLDSGWNRRLPVKLLCGGEVLTHDLAERLLDRGTSLWNMYGPTETTVWSSVSEVHRGDVEIGIGSPIPNLTYHVLDEELRPVPVGKAGELCIGGIGLSPGYLNKPALTLKKFVTWSSDGKMERLYRSGDRVRMSVDGTLEYLGRLDNQVKLRGHRIEPQEIEAVLQGLSGIRANAVGIQTRGADDQRLIAYILVRPPDPPSEDQIRRHLKERLPEYMLPSDYVFVDSLPLTTSGKIDRQALSRLSPQGPSRKRKGGAILKDPLQDQLLILWQELLGKTDIGSSDNFFDLGGHSLLAVRLIDRIEKATSVRLSVETVFLAPNIRDMAAIIRQNARSPASSLLVPVQPEGTNEPFYCVHDISGDVFVFHELSSRLGKERPFYAVRARGLANGEKPHTDIQDMASDYIRAVKALQPRGPYFIGGYSFGGVVAFEMAQQMTAQGMEIRLLAIIDEFAPPSREDGERRHSLMGTLNMICNLPYWVLDFKIWEEENFLVSILPRLRRALDRMTQSMKRGEIGRRIRDELGRASRGARKGLQKIVEANIEAYERYVPRKYPGDIVLFRTRALPLLKSDDPAMGWRALVEGKVRIRRIAGTHVNMLRFPTSESLARQLRLFFRPD
jgi:amino acid adenylation domain-containing protein